MIEIPKQQLRKAFLQTLTKLAEEDERIIFIVGDVGFSFCEEFIKRFPNQFVNGGISEQNMMTMAPGLASTNWKPYVYTMTNFVLARPYEQVRNDIDFPKANVKLFGVEGSAAYKFLGISHNLYEGEEDALLSSFNNTNKYFPQTEEQVKAFMELEYDREGPSYMRI